MERDNVTTFPQFILLGFTKDQDLNIILFSLFLITYAMTLIGNIGMMMLIRRDTRLHKPMYFFLGHLSFLDTCYSSVISPKMLMNFLQVISSISFFGCATQSFFFVALGSAECILLAGMAYDRYVAICNPLLYVVIMTRPLCFWLVAGSYIGGFLHSIIYVSFTFKLPFCKSHEIDHFFCDIPQLLKLSCVDTTYIEILLFAFTGSIGMSCLILITVSYVLIMSSILKMTTVKRRMQTFSTCASHLTAVNIFYGTILFIYLRPQSMYNTNQDRVVSVFYTIIIPMLNPLIYSVRNKEVKLSLRQVLTW